MDQSKGEFKKDPSLRTSLHTHHKTKRPKLTICTGSSSCWKKSPRLKGPTIIKMLIAIRIINKRMFSNLTAAIDPLPLTSAFFLEGIVLRDVAFCWLVFDEDFLAKPLTPLIDHFFLFNLPEGLDCTGSR